MQRHRPRMNRRFRRAVHREARHWNECQSRRDINQGRVWLRCEVWQKRGGHADRREQVGSNLHLQMFVLKSGLRTEVYVHLYSSIVNDAIQCRTIRHDSLRYILDRLSAGHIHHIRRQSGMTMAEFLQTEFTPSADDDLIPALMERLGEAASDAGAPSRNEDGVALHLHIRWMPKNQISTVP